MLFIPLCSLLLHLVLLFLCFPLILHVTLLRFSLLLLPPILLLLLLLLLPILLLLLMLQQRCFDLCCCISSSCSCYLRSRFGCFRTSLLLCRSFTLFASLALSLSRTRLCFFYRSFTVYQCLSKSPEMLRQRRSSASCSALVIS